MTDPRAEIERFKTDIDLINIAEDYGYEVQGKRSRSTTMKKGDSKIIVTVKPDGHWTFWDAKDDSFKGTVLDFLLRQEGGDFPKICQKCREYLNMPARDNKPAPIVKREYNDLFKDWRKLQPYKSGYLESRGLDQATIERFASKIRTDEHGNACFQHQDMQGNVTGWEKKNKGFTGFSAEGSKTLFICRVDEAVITNIIVCESAIDAMSYYQITKQPGIYVSFAGAMSPEQEKQLTELLHRYPAAKIHAATDNDMQGDKCAAFLARSHDHVERKRPRCVKDWNDVLQASLSRSR